MLKSNLGRQWSCPCCKKMVTVEKKGSPLTKYSDWHCHWSKFPLKTEEVFSSNTGGYCFRVALFAPPKDKQWSQWHRSEKLWDRITYGTQNRTGHPWYPAVQLRLTYDQIRTGSESLHVKYGSNEKKRMEIIGNHVNMRDLLRSLASNQHWTFDTFYVL